MTSVLLWLGVWHQFAVHGMYFFTAPHRHSSNDWDQGPLEMYKEPNMKHIIKWRYKGYYPGFLSLSFSHPGQTEVKDGSPSVWQKEERWRTCETIWEDQRKLLNMKTATSLRTAAELQDFIEERKSNLTRWGKLSRSGITRFGTTMK